MDSVSWEGQIDGQRSMGMYQTAHIATINRNWIG